MSAEFACLREDSPRPPRAHHLHQSPLLPFDVLSIAQQSLLPASEASLSYSVFSRPNKGSRSARRDAPVVRSLCVQRPEGARSPLHPRLPDLAPSPIRTHLDHRRWHPLSCSAKSTMTTSEGKALYSVPVPPASQCACPTEMLLSSLSLLAGMSESRRVVRFSRF